MTLTILPDLEQGSEAWHDQRRGMVTASVVGQLITSKMLTAIDYGCPDCGANPYSPCVSKRDGSPIKTLHPARAGVAADDNAPPILEPAVNDYSRGLTAVLTAERINGFTDPNFISNDMLRGIQDEPTAREVYSEHFAPVTEVGFMVRTESWGTLGYSPDGLVGDDGLIEVKSRRSKKQLLTAITGEVPPENVAQLMAGLLVSGRKWIDYVSFAGGMHLYVKRVYPDPVWFDAITAAVALFEKNSADMAAAYTEATKGMPLTERSLVLEEMY